MDSEVLSAVQAAIEENRRLRQQVEQLQFRFQDDELAEIRRQERRPLTEHLSDYRLALTAKGDGVRHVRDSFRRLRVMIRLCRATVWRDLDEHEIQVARMKLLAPRPRRKAVGLATANHYVTALKTFCNWMVRLRRAGRSPCLGLRPLNAKIDVRHARRALTADEVHLLVTTTWHKGRTIGGITGRERALVYYVASVTGLRAGEISSLTLASFQLDAANPQLIVEARNSKGKRKHIVQLEPFAAELVRAHIEQMPEGRQEVLLRPANSMRALRLDLALAGIPYVVNGEHADFHALRHTFITGVIRKGATLKEAQTLARHTDPRLTLAVYAHVSANEERAAVERLPWTDTGSRLCSAIKSPLDERTAAHGTVTRTGPLQPTLTAALTAPTR